MNPIRAMRLRRDLSQEALAKRLKRPREYIVAVERGEYEPRIDTLRRLAAALDCTVADLIP